MYHDSGTARVGFEDRESTLDAPACGRTKQNSYRMLMDAVGPWPGGPRPSPAPPLPDAAAAPDATPLADAAPIADAAPDASFAEEGDAAAPAREQAAGAGCSYASARHPVSRGWLAVALLALALARRRVTGPGPAAPRVPARHRR
jgi:hypothetical protein